MIEGICFKGCEAVSMENNYLRVVLLPTIGGKVASIYNKKKSFELLYQNKAMTYEKAKIYDDFGKYDASGFDDAFPTIEACSVVYGSDKIEYPDHGEIWSRAFEYKIEEKLVRLYYKSEIFPYDYEKTLFLEGESLIINYRIKNTGESNFPCIWTMHCLTVCDEEMEIHFPEGTFEVINVLDGEDLGEVGELHPYPLTKNRAGDEFRLNRVRDKSAGRMKKYYVNGKVEKGACGIYYPKNDVRYNIYFDKDKLPYLGFWVTEGGFRGDYNCALEPSTGFYDNVNTATKNNRIFVLKPKEELTFVIKIELT